DDSVEFVFLPKEKDEKDECLAGFFDDWRRDDCGECFAGFFTCKCRDSNSGAGVEKESKEGGNQCAPEKSGGEHPEGFRFVTIDPQDQGDVERNWNRRGQETE